MNKPEGERLDLKRAIALVISHTGLEAAEAATLLQLACSSGEVASWGCRLIERFPSVRLISVEEWRQHTIGDDHECLRGGAGGFSVIVSVTINAAGLQRWLSGRSRTAKLKRVRHKESKDAAVKEWFAKSHPGGIPAGTAWKEIARNFTKDTRITLNERTVRRALTRK